MPGQAATVPSAFPTDFSLSLAGSWHSAIFRARHGGASALPKVPETMRSQDLPACDANDFGGIQINHQRSANILVHAGIEKGNGSI
jgi:hypothetical protein